MAQRGAIDLGFFLVDGLDLAGEMTSITGPSVEQNLADGQVMLGVWNASRAAGTLKGSLAQGGIFTDAVGGNHDSIVNHQDVKRILCIGLAGNLLGRSFTGMAGAYAAKWNVKDQQNQLVLADAEYAVAGEVDDGVILHPLGSDTAAGNGESAPVDRVADPMASAIAVATSSVDNPTVITCAADHGLTDGDPVVIAGHTGSTPAINGAQTATVLDARRFSIPVTVTVAGSGGTVTRAWTKNGGAGYLQVKSVTLDGATVTVKVRHSANGSAFVDLLTFTAVAGVGAERKTVASGTTVNRHLAYSMAVSGAGPNFAIDYLMGFARA